VCGVEAANNLHFILKAVQIGLEGIVFRGTREDTCMANWDDELHGYKDEMDGLASTLAVVWIVTIAIIPSVLLFSSPDQEYPLSFFTVIGLSQYTTYLLSGGLVLLWAICVGVELRMVRLWVRPESFKTTLFRHNIFHSQFILIAILLLALFFWLRILEDYSRILATYCLFDLWNWQCRRFYLTALIHSARKLLDERISEIGPLSKTPKADAERREVEIRRAGIEVIEEFYIKRPQRRRVIVLGSVTTVIAILSVPPLLDIIATHVHMAKATLASIGYGTILLTMIGCEAFMFKWRSIATGRSAVLAAELHKVKNSLENLGRARRRRKTP
jgi:hypothetical protein